MDLEDMIALVRIDLKDTDEDNYRWTDDELARAITRAVTMFSRYCPLLTMSTLETVPGSNELDISSLTPRISVDKLEFPVGNIPRTFIPFEVYLDILLMLSVTGNGEDCNVYWSTVHTLDESGSTIPPQHEDLISLGASAYAAIAQAQYSTNRANYGGEDADRDYRSWGEARLREFIKSCEKLKSKLLPRRLINDDK
jgi:hypothetical protein